MLLDDDCHCLISGEVDMHLTQNGLIYNQQEESG